MKAKDLKDGDIVIFKQYSSILDKEDYQDGSVISVDVENKEVSVVWLEGLVSRTDDIPFEKLVAKFDESGEMMTFGVLSGTSVLIEEV